MRELFYIIVGGLLLLGLLYIYARWVEPNWLKVNFVEIKIPNLDPRLEGFTILHLTDLHQARFGYHQQKLLAAISGNEYHMVALTGDFLDYPRPYDFGPTAELLQGLAAPVYYVFGNHDYPCYQALARELSINGVQTLANSTTEISHNGASLQLVGIHDPYWTKNNPGSWLQTDWNATLAGWNSAKTTVLLSHSPGALDKAAAVQISLILCGHTHGGQVKLPLVGAPTAGSGVLFDRQVQGLFKKGNTQLYINRGLGTTALPLRFLSRPEVAFIRLLKAD